MEKLARLRGALFPDGDFAPVASRILSWSQVEEMATHQIDIESHTQNHIHIATTDLATVDRELSESKKAIESHTGRSVSGFAYPFGKDLASYRTVEPLLRKHGFAYACNACHGNNSTSSNVFSLFRCTLPLTTSSALINYQFQVLFQQKSPDGHAPVAADRRSETATET
jgi:hypothetical protein